MRNILFLMASSFWLQGCVTTTNSDTFGDWGLLNGSIMTQEACNHPNTSVWVSVAGKGECIRYFHSGLDRSNEIVHVWLHGDRMRHSFGGHRRSVAYENETPQKQQKRADRVYQKYEIPYIGLSRPGTYGSSGFHDQRRRPHNVKMALAAFDALKEKYSIKKFAISGQSGGGHLVGALLANRNDIVCAVSTSGVLAVGQRNQARRWRTDITGYSDFHDPIDHVHEIAGDENRRIFIVADPRDTNVPFKTQKSYFERVKEHGHNVFLIKAQGGGRSHHSLEYAGFQITKWCIDGAPSAEILVRARFVKVFGSFHRPNSPPSG